MPDITRRSLLRKGGLAASAATLGPATIAQVSHDYPESVFHVFAFQWKPETTDAEKTRAAKDIAAFQGNIPGLTSKLTSAPTFRREEKAIHSVASCSSKTRHLSTHMFSIRPIRPC